MIVNILEIVTLDMERVLSLDYPRIYGSAAMERLTIMPSFTMVSQDVSGPSPSSYRVKGGLRKLFWVCRDRSKCFQIICLIANCFFWNDPLSLRDKIGSPLPPLSLHCKDKEFPSNFDVVPNLFPVKIKCQNKLCKSIYTSSFIGSKVDPGLA